MDVDPDTIARLQRGQLEALGAVYAALGDRVFRVCRHLLGQDADAEDATQETFMKVWDHAAQFAGRASFATWVHRIAVHHCYWRLPQRKGRRERQEGAETLGKLAVERDGVAGVEERELVERLLEELPEEQRAVVVLREIEGLAYQEIAEVLDVPIGTVMSRLNRARARLSAAAAGRLAHERR